MKIHEVEDGGLFVRRDKVQCCARVICSGLGAVVVSPHPLSQAPGQNGHWPGSESLAGLAEHGSDTLFFGRVDVGERPSGLENLPEHSCRTAFEWHCTIMDASPRPKDETPNPELRLRTPNSAYNEIKCAHPAP